MKRKTTTRCRTCRRELENLIQLLEATGNPCNWVIMRYKFSRASRMSDSLLLLKVERVMQARREPKTRVSRHSMQINFHDSERPNRAWPACRKCGSCLLINLSGELKCGKFSHHVCVLCLIEDKWRQTSWRRNANLVSWPIVEAAIRLTMETTITFFIIRVSGVEWTEISF